MVNILEKSPGTLFVIATPIGNLEDITIRAIRILNEVYLIASEDTRHTKKLLQHLDINTPLVSYYKENETFRAEKLIEELLNGHNVALVSDAGTPCISDPGSILVDKAHINGIKVEVVPGPSALTAAVSMSGMIYDYFSFYGFVPSKKNTRIKFLKSLKENTGLLIFYESPKRIVKCLESILEVFGDRSVFVVRELTKIHEEYFRGTVSLVVEQLADKAMIKGEFVIILHGGELKIQPEGDDLNEILQWYHDQGDNSLSYSVKKVAKELGIAKSTVYKEALKIWE